MIAALNNLRTLLFETVGAKANPELGAQEAPTCASNPRSLLHETSLALIMHIELLSDDITELQDLVGHFLGTYLLIAQHLQGCPLILRQFVEIFL